MKQQAVLTYEYVIEYDTPTYNLTAAEMAKLLYPNDNTPLEPLDPRVYDEGITHEDLLYEAWFSSEVYGTIIYLYHAEDFENEPREPLYFGLQSNDSLKCWSVAVTLDPETAAEDGFTIFGHIDNYNVQVVPI
jgi:hypothetical protein